MEMEQNGGNDAQFAKNNDFVKAFFHTGPVEGWHSWLKGGLEPSVVNLDPGCLES